MEPRLRPARSRLPAVLFLLVCLGVGAWGASIFLLPSMEQVPPPDTPRLIIEGQTLAPSPWLEEGEVFLPVEVVKAHLDPTIRWDEGEGLVIITTGTSVVKMATDRLTALVNLEPMELEVPVLARDGQLYLPLGLAERYYGITASTYPSGAVVLDLPGQPVQTGVCALEGFLREAPTMKAPFTSRLPVGSTVRIHGEENRHYLVLSEEGILGYLDKSRVTLGAIIVPSAPPPPRPEPWRPLGQPINLTWEHVMNRNPDPLGIPDMPGANVISPTWFALSSPSGHISSKADLAYVEWAHSRGYRVWALVSNAFDPRMTSEFLADTEARDFFTRQILAYCALYDLDGINVDFENMYMEDRDNFVHFLRELVPPAHEQGLVVSVDVTVRSNNPNWSLCYDRTAIAQVADYVVLMAYDQYAAGSPSPGPVASIPWTEWAVIKTLEEVPPERLVLGIPFYTRIWRNEQGNYTSKAYGIGRAHSILLEKGADIVLEEETGLYFGQYEEGGAGYVAWLEDAATLRQRVELVNKYRLAGVASWRRGLEPDWAWTVMADVLRGPR